MEYERALFRVYERCLEGLRDDVGETPDIGTKTCRICESISFSGAVFFLVSLIYLHVSFVGHEGCLPLVLHDLGTIRNVSGILYLRDDQILQIHVESLLPFGYDDSGSDAVNAVDSNEARRFLRLGDGPKFLMEDIQSNVTNKVENIGPKKLNSSIYDFEFALDYSVLTLPYTIRQSHNFQSINITISNKYSCFGSKFTQSLVPLGGIDTIIINSLMFTFKKPGVLKSAAGDIYTWSDTDISPYSNISEWINFKLNILLASILAFIFISTTTALLVRVIISSGVVLIFPFFWILQAFGMQPLNIRLISLSYPWLGVPIEMLMANNQPTVPYILSHIMRVLVLYLMYQATQLAFAIWFYGQEEPGQKELWLYAIMMLWEYYSMVYVRSVTSIRLFPRVSMAFFLIYHFYLYSYPAGFHVLALLVLFTCLTWLMIRCVADYERKAYIRGEVSIEQPRALYNALPWPSWNVALAPDYSLFMPVTRRAVSIYEENVGTRPGAADGGEVLMVGTGNIVNQTGESIINNGTSQNTETTGFTLQQRLQSVRQAVSSAVADLHRGYSPVTMDGRRGSISLDDHRSDSDANQAVGQGMQQHQLSQNPGALSTPPSGGPVPRSSGIHSGDLDEGNPAITQNVMHRSL